MNPARPLAPPSPRRAFTLVELLVVIGIIAVLMGILVPVVNKARASGNTVKCLSNIRSLALAQALYASDRQNLLVAAGEGSVNVQGSWIGLLESAGGEALVRLCPSDKSPFLEAPNTDTGAPLMRLTSYGINNYVSPTHVPLGVKAPKRVAEVRSPSTTIHFVELAETGAYAIADHLHVQKFYNPLSPSTTAKRMSEQMPIGRHGGTREKPDGMLNYAFLDGHAETLRARDVYTDPKTNLFIPEVTK